MSSEGEFLVIYITTKKLRMGFGSQIKTHLPWCLHVGMYMPVRKMLSCPYRRWGSRLYLVSTCKRLLPSIHPRISEIFTYNLCERHELLECQLESRWDRYSTAFQSTPDSCIWPIESSLGSSLIIVGTKHLAHLDTCIEDSDLGVLIFKLNPILWAGLGHLNLCIQCHLRGPKVSCLASRCWPRKLQVS